MTGKKFVFEPELLRQIIFLCLSKKSMDFHYKKIHKIFITLFFI